MATLDVKCGSFKIVKTDIGIESEDSIHIELDQVGAVMEVQGVLGDVDLHDLCVVEYT